jgi:hypothetical protein
VTSRGRVLLLLFNLANPRLGEDDDEYDDESMAGTGSWPELILCGPSFCVGLSALVVAGAMSVSTKVVTPETSLPFDVPAFHLCLPNILESLEGAIVMRLWWLRIMFLHVPAAALFGGHSPLSCTPISTVHYRTVFGRSSVMKVHV